MNNWNHAEHKLKRKYYSSLSQVKNEIEKKGDEKVTEFTGEYLYTKRGRKEIRYGLYDGNISVTIIGED